MADLRCDCHDGWIVEEYDGARIVKDRCLKCNEPPWYAEQRRQALWARWWPFFIIGGIILADVGAFGIAALLRAQFGNG